MLRLARQPSLEDLFKYPWKAPSTWTALRAYVNLGVGVFPADWELLCRPAIANKSCISDGVTGLTGSTASFVSFRYVVLDSTSPMENTIGVHTCLF
jgi:hypothetical protein